LQRELSFKNGQDDAEVGSDPSVSLAAYELVRGRILDGSLAPGAVLSQLGLASQLGVSRTPLREAILRLQKEGLVEIEPRKRARVADLNVNEIENIYAIRILLEPLAGSLTVPLLTAGELAEIADSIAMMIETEQQPEAWEVHHRRFHHLLICHADSHTVDRLDALRERALRYRQVWSFPGSYETEWRRGREEHLSLAAACRASDAASLRRELASHLANVAFGVMTAMDASREPKLLRMALRMVLTGEPESDAADISSARRRTAKRNAASSGN
jgi:DNA-binding GntR family transcriptional regulator